MTSVISVRPYKVFFFKWCLSLYWKGKQAETKEGNVTFEECGEALRAVHSRSAHLATTACPNPTGTLCVFESCLQSHLVARSVASL